MEKILLFLFFIQLNCQTFDFTLTYDYKLLVFNLLLFIMVLWILKPFHFSIVSRLIANLSRNLIDQFFNLCFLMLHENIVCLIILIFVPLQNVIYMVTKVPDMSMELGFVPLDLFPKLSGEVCCKLGHLGDSLFIVMILSMWLLPLGFLDYDCCGLFVTFYKWSC